MWRGQLKTQVGTMGTGDTANTSPLIPNLTPSYLVVTSPKTIILKKALLKCHLLHEAFQDAPSQTFLLPLSLILCHSSLHHSTHLPAYPLA